MTPPIEIDVFEMGSGNWVARLSGTEIESSVFEPFREWAVMRLLREQKIIQINLLMPDDL